jgi:hypothetical protein
VGISCTFAQQLVSPEGPRACITLQNLFGIQIADLEASGLIRVA